jgi:hypothetical protein
MSGLEFDAAPLPRIAASAPERMDVACFVGFVRARGAPLDDALRAFLGERGFSDSSALLDVPVPIERFGDFQRWFAWEPRDAAPASAQYLGAAVRSFFAQGGRKCYVVRAGDPRPLLARRPPPGDALARLVPDRASPSDRSSWRGAAHAFGLPDVSLLCLPDLADVFAVDVPIPPLDPPARAGSVGFEACTAPGPLPPLDHAFRTVPAPRCDDDGYRAWAAAIERIAWMLDGDAPDVQLVAALPLPTADARAAKEPAAFVNDTFPPGLPGASRAVQLVYPWASTPRSAELPEGLESPDAVLAGVLARNALQRGAFHSAAGLDLFDVDELAPIVERAEIARGIDDRVCILGPTPGGLRVLSDVTLAPRGAYRFGAVSRLAAVVRRALRQIGEQTVFEASGPGAWAALRARAEHVMGCLFRAGALRGATPAQAFSVRCDRTTMTQDDLDAGRLVAEVELDPALPVERIRVVLALGGGAVTTEDGP